MKGIKQVTLDESQHLVSLLESGHVKDFSLAVDGGAHAGAWTVIMATYFKEVHAFEPHPRAFEYLTENCAGLDNVVMHNAALMDVKCGIDVYAPGRTTLTATQVRYNPDSLNTAVTIDSYDLQECGLLKLDVEGAELKAILGAAETIKRCRPFIVVEMNNLGKRFGSTDRDLSQKIRSFGYSEVWAKGVDRGFAPNEQ